MPQKYGLKLSILYGTIWCLVLLDISILNTALPTIANYFGYLTTQSEWVIIGFMLSLILSMSAGSWLCDRFGTKKIFVLAQIGYIISSLLCGISSSLNLLILANCIRGLSGGLMGPSGLTMFMRKVPQLTRLKHVLRINIVTLVVPAIGPIFSSYILDVFGWRYVFLLKMPIFILTAILSIIWLKETTFFYKKKFDLTGFLFAAMSLTCLLLAFSIIGESETQLVSIFALFSLFGLFAFWFLKQELTNQNPLINFSIFESKLFILGSVIQFFAGAIFFGLTFATNLYLQRALKFDIITTGWTLASVAPGIILALPISYLFTKFFTTRISVILNLSVLFVSIIALCFITPETSLFILTIILFFQGLSFTSCILITNKVPYFADIKPELMSSASTISQLVRLLAAILGISISSMILTMTLYIFKINNLVETNFAVSRFPFIITFLLFASILLYAAFVITKLSSMHNFNPKSDS